MVKLLQCQEELVSPSYPDKEELELFAVALICSLLDTFEVDLTPEESQEIKRFCSDWAKNAT